PIPAKLDRLGEIIAGMNGVVVAYSGGADSALVAEMAHRRLGSRSVTVIADSPSLPRSELTQALELGVTRGWNVQVVNTGELEDERYAANPANRCFFCKHALMQTLQPLATERGWEILLGTNTDDLGDWRPGTKAADEAGARHPLVEAEMSKAEVRRFSAALGLPTAEKEASACLASRIAYGTRVTQEALSRIEHAEGRLKELGYSHVRVRDLGADRASVEVDAGQVGRLMQEPGIGDLLSSLGFRFVEIDPRGYRQGSMNEALA
ncbi:MAG: ATP-dependent sacrificial sulfur transferase LarE, partial [Actinomycetota bacterium]